MAQLTEEQRAQIRALRAAEGKDAAKAMRFQMRTQAGLKTNPANAPAAATKVVQRTPEELARIREARNTPDANGISNQILYRDAQSQGLSPFIQETPSAPAAPPPAAPPAPGANPNRLSPEQRAQIAALRASEGQEAAKALRFQLRTEAGLPTNPANAPAATDTVPPADTAPAEDKPVRFGPRISKRMDKMFGLGQEMVNRFLPDISVLGTVDPARSAEMQETLAMSKGGLGGLTAAENEALRARGYEELNRQFMGGQRALGRLQARSGVQGAAATAQFGDLMRQRGQQAAGMEQDIMLRNIAVQDQRRQAFQNLLRTAEQDELAREQFNIGQQANLLSGQQALFFGGAGLANQLMEQQRQRRMEREQMEAIRQGQIAQANAYQNAYGQLMGMSGAAGAPLDMGPTAPQANPNVQPTSSPSDAFWTGGGAINYNPGF